MTENPGGSALLTVPEVAARLRVSRRTAYALVKDGSIESVVVGRRMTRVAVEALARYVAAQTRPAA